jgi:hypothetical protein
LVTAELDFSLAQAHGAYALTIRLTSGEETIFRFRKPWSVENPQKVADQAMASVRSKGVQA